MLEFTFMKPMAEVYSAKPLKKSGGKDLGEKMLLKLHRRESKQTLCQF